MTLAILCSRLKRTGVVNLKHQISLLTLFLAITLQLRATEQVFTDLNFAITLPDTWSAITNVTIEPGKFLVIYRAPKNHTLFFVQVDSSRTPTGPMNEKFIEDFDRGLEKNNAGKRISGKFIQMDGVKAYERISNPLIQTQQVSCILHAVLTSERFYDIQGVTLKNAADDPDIQKALASFRFLTPAHEPIESPESAAYRAGYIVGRYGTLCVLIAGTLFVIIFMILKSHRSKPPLLPPNA
jgi:hypothetical protein